MFFIAIDRVHWKTLQCCFFISFFQITAIKRHQPSICAYNQADIQCHFNQTPIVHPLCLQHIACLSVVTFLSPAMHSSSERREWYALLVVLPRMAPEYARPPMALMKIHCYQTTRADKMDGVWRDVTRQTRITSRSSAVCGFERTECEWGLVGIKI